MLTGRQYEFRYYMAQIYVKSYESKSNKSRTVKLSRAQAPHS